MRELGDATERARDIPLPNLKYANAQTGVPDYAPWCIVVDLETNLEVKNVMVAHIDEGLLSVGTEHGAEERRGRFELRLRGDAPREIREMAGFE